MTSERAAEVKERIEGREGPPEGVTSIAVQFLYDADQQTMVVVQQFASSDDMKASEEALSAMDPSETPGTRASVDRCELLIERSM